MLVGHPRKMPMDPFETHKIPWKERVELRKKLQHSDPQALRFGLTMTLPGRMALRPERRPEGDQRGDSRQPGRRKAPRNAGNRGNSHQ
jgi:hypothetical protein